MERRRIEGHPSRGILNGAGMGGCPRFTAAGRGSREVRRPILGWPVVKARRFRLACAGIFRGIITVLKNVLLAGAALFLGVGAAADQPPTPSQPATAQAAAGKKPETGATAEPNAGVLFKPERSDSD